MRIFIGLLLGLAFCLSVPSFATSPLPDGDRLVVVDHQDVDLIADILQLASVQYQYQAGRGVDFVPVCIYGSYHFDTATTWAPEFGSVRMALQYTGHQAKVYRGERAYLLKI